MLESATPNPRSRSRWYANATKGPLNWYQVTRARTGLSTTQLRRLRMLSHGVVVTHNDFGITLQDSWHYISTLRKKLPWLVVRRIIGVGYIIPEDELAKLKSFLGMEE